MSNRWNHARGIAFWGPSLKDEFFQCMLPHTEYGKGTFFGTEVKGCPKGHEAVRPHAVVRHFKKVDD